jgi:hypothetical protein
MSSHENVVGTFLVYYINNNYYYYYLITLNRVNLNHKSSFIELQTNKTKKNGVFWVVTPCGSCKNRRFGGTWYFFAAYVGC